MTDGSEVHDLNTSAEIIREERPCGHCGATTTVDIVRTQRPFDYLDVWTCPLCSSTMGVSVNGDDATDETDPDSWHDAMQEED